MRSFALSVFASLAFGIFCSAAPTPAGISTNVIARDLELPAEDSKCLESVLSGVVIELSPIKEQITQLNTVVVTVDLVEPILADIKGILECAIVDVKALAEIDINVALHSVTTGVLLDVKGVAVLLSGVLHIVCFLLQLVLQIVTGAVKDTVLPLVLEILCLVGDLVAVVLSLVACLLTGVLAALLPLIGDLVSFIYVLNVKTLIEILCI